MPALLLLGLTAGPLVIWFSAWLMTAYGAGVALYAAVVGLASLVLTARARDVRLLPWFPLVFFSIHAGAGFGILREFAAGSRPSQPPRRAPLTVRLPVQRKPQKVAV